MKKLSIGRETLTTLDTNLDHLAGGQTDTRYPVTRCNCTTVNPGPCEYTATWCYMTKQWSCQCVTSPGPSAGCTR